MSVILEFTVDSEDFQLGEVLVGPANMQFELDRIVPTGYMMMPFVWVTGESDATFEEHVRTHPAVEKLYVLDNLDNRRLYRIEWNESPTDLIDAIAAVDGSVLEARGNDEWQFRVRFTDHDTLSQFHTAVIDQGIPIRIDRTYPLEATPDHGYRFGLTVDQREALLLALERGYFTTPRATTLEEMADKLDISKQALSVRIRRANEKVLSDVLLSAERNSSDGK